MVMTLEELSAKLDMQSAKLDAQSAKIDAQSAKMDAQSGKLEEKFSSIDARFENIDARFEKIDARFEKIEASMHQGFNDSKTRDEHLRDLMKFGLEAREVLRDEMHRRFDAVESKQEQQVSLLHEAVRHVSNHK